jgi:PKD repeat protein
MSRQLTGTRAVMLVALLAIATGPQQAFGKRGYGETVDDFCWGYDGSLPFADLGGDRNSGGNDGGCLLCHQNTRGDGSQPGTWTWWRSRDYYLFCNGAPPNRAPTGTIVQPNRDVEITAGSTVRFEGSGNDPDGDALQFQWTIGSSTRAGAGPHFVAFANPGTYSATLYVSDGLLDDPTPQTRFITVTSAASCADVDGDGFSVGDVSCGPLDCDDHDSAVNPNAIELCSDGIDNNCDGRIDLADPLAVGCEGCLDADGDKYSPDGGVCGPADCDDGDPTVSPGAPEVCGDGIDNDCDFQVDDADAECDGTDCIGALLPASVFRLQVATDPGREPAQPLEGAPVAGDIYVFVPSEPGISQVRYYLDGQLSQTENYAPWDLSGGSSSAADPLQTRNLMNGWHSVLAEIDTDSGQTHTISANFEVANAANRPPTCSIDAPAGNQVIKVGDSLSFAGSAMDPDGDLPLSFAWDFGGAAAASAQENPGAVRFNAAGVFTVSFGVTDRLGLGCTSPATRVITVEEEPEDTFDAHPISQNYAKEAHKNDWKRRPDFCRDCHGSNLRGTSASATFEARVWKSKIKQPDGSEYKRYAAGEYVGCMDCHKSEHLWDDDDDEDEEDDD